VILLRQSGQPHERMLDYRLLLQGRSSALGHSGAVPDRLHLVHREAPPCSKLFAAGSRGSDLAAAAQLFTSASRFLDQDYGVLRHVLRGNGVVVVRDRGAPAAQYRPRSRRARSALCSGRAHNTGGFDERICANSACSTLALAGGAVDAQDAGMKKWTKGKGWDGSGDLRTKLAALKLVTQERPDLGLPTLP